MLMNHTLRKAATSLILIVAFALGTRIAFAWYEERQISARVLSIVPFQTETGHIAYSIASGKGFSSPFQRDTGPTAWLAPVYPYLLAGIFKLFGIYTLRSFFAALFLNILFSAGACVPIFYGGKRIAGLGVASAAAWLWAPFSQRHHHSVRMDLGHVLVGALTGNSAVGHIRVGGIPLSSRLVPLRPLVGLRAAHQSRRRSASSRVIGVGRLSQSESGSHFRVARSSNACRRDRSSLLRALDRPKLRSIPQIHPAAVEFRIRTVCRQ